MKSFFTRYIGALIAISVLGACQSGEIVKDTSNKVEENQSQSSIENDINEPNEIVAIAGLADHYHTGDTIELTAELEEDLEYDHWHWYTLAPNQDPENDDAWEVVPNNETKTFSGTATEDGEQIQARLFDNDHKIVAKSVPQIITIDDHHGSDYVSKRIYEGFFYFDEVGERELSDFAGDWQSVYPYLLNGELDEVMEVKAQNNDKKSKEDFIKQYQIAYETDVNRVVISDDSFTFYYDDGREVSAKYKSEGYEILERDAGNRQVRHVYKKSDDTKDMPTYMIFSDHNINTAPAHHFHLYFGEDRDALLAERTHFPTYYPSKLDGAGIVRDMLAH
ncbi:ZinT/AdcA family metal-binding protein [Bacillus mesophilum]|uniref:Metal-binding protein ZinT n=1 Tax=Bacillus mesophilum TaxID=1071718 RepID=A0A7V7RKC0_9BACI|nr:ZinT/AdcA family metal-binding protein [Bacillus mesophilum]KAB2331715.1 metal-binding protein ZinT [Bacillus mesophilum]